MIESKEINDEHRRAKNPGKQGKRETSRPVEFARFGHRTASIKIMVVKMARKGCR